MNSQTVTGSLAIQPALDHQHLLASPVSSALAKLDGVEVKVAKIDPELADTAAFCEAYGVSLSASANCVVIAGKRGSEIRYAAALVLGTTRADVNGIIKRRLDARKASFAPMDDAVHLTGMEYGGITPVGLPDSWPILVDARVAHSPELIIGSGIRSSKLVVSGDFLAGLPNAEVIENLAKSAD